MYWRSSDLDAQKKERQEDAKRYPKVPIHSSSSLFGPKFLDSPVGDKDDCCDESADYGQTYSNVLHVYSFGRRKPRPSVSAMMPAAMKSQKMTSLPIETRLEISTGCIFTPLKSQACRITSKRAGTQLKTQRWELVRPFPNPMRSSERELLQLR